MCQLRQEFKKEDRESFQEIERLKGNLFEERGARDMARARVDALEGQLAEERATHEEQTGLLREGRVSGLNERSKLLARVKELEEEEEKACLGCVETLTENKKLRAELQELKNGPWYYWAEAVTKEKRRVKVLEERVKELQGRSDIDADFEAIFDRLVTLEKKTEHLS